MACEAAAETGRPISRPSLTDLVARATRALNRPVGRTTVWRMPHEDAIEPWQFAHWILPRDPAFAQKGGPILDRDQGRWGGRPLGPTAFGLSSAEKTSIQARQRRPDERPPGPGRARRVETAYKRRGAPPYLAAWAVRRGLVLGRCEGETGSKPVGRLVDPLLSREPSREAGRIFPIVDNGSWHRGQAPVERLRRRGKRITLGPTPVHASWLNRVEIYFSIIRGRVPTPNAFPDPGAVRVRLALSEELTNRRPKPVAGKVTRQDLAGWLKRAAPHFVAAPAA